MTLTAMTDKEKQQQQKIQKPVEKPEELVYVADTDTHQTHLYRDKMFC